MSAKPGRLTAILIIIAGLLILIFAVSQILPSKQKKTAETNFPASLKTAQDEYIEPNTKGALIIPAGQWPMIRMREPNTNTDNPNVLDVE